MRHERILLTVRERKRDTEPGADLAHGRCWAGELPAQRYGLTSCCFPLAMVLRTDPGYLFRRQAHAQSRCRVTFLVNKAQATEPVPGSVHDFQDQHVSPVR